MNATKTPSRTHTIINWIITHSGEPETPTARSRGLHGSRLNPDIDRMSSHPTRFVLPANSLS